MAAPTQKTPLLANPKTPLLANHLSPAAMPDYYQRPQLVKPALPPPTISTLSSCCLRHQHAPTPSINSCQSTQPLVGVSMPSRLVARLSQQKERVALASAVCLCIVDQHARLAGNITVPGNICVLPVLLSQVPCKRSAAHDLPSSICALVSPTASPPHRTTTPPLPPPPAPAATHTTTGMSDGWGVCSKVFRFWWFVFAFVMATLLGLLLCTFKTLWLHYSRPFW